MIALNDFVMWNSEPFMDRGSPGFTRRLTKLDIQCMPAYRRPDIGAAYKQKPEPGGRGKHDKTNSKQKLSVKYVQYKTDIYQQSTHMVETIREVEEGFGLDGRPKRFFEKKRTIEQVAYKGQDNLIDCTGRERKMKDNTIQRYRTNEVRTELDRVHCKRTINVEVTTYRMKMEPFGALLIFHNTKFKHCEELKGTTLDAELMKTTFNGKFRISHYVNKKMDEMKSILADVHQILEDTDSMIMCYFTSHGSPKGVIASDEGVLSYAHIQEALMNDKLHSMNGKPKLIILDCCRGLKSHPFKAKSKAEVSAETELLSEKIHSDMAILKAAPDQYVSLGSDIQPSVFTAAFCKAFTKSTTLDYTDIVHETTAIIKQKVHLQQCVPESISYLDARLIFSRSQ